MDCNHIRRLHQSSCFYLVYGGVRPSFFCIMIVEFQCFWHNKFQWVSPEKNSPAYPVWALIFRTRRKLIEWDWSFFSSSSLWTCFCCFTADSQRQEVSVGGGASRHCFYDLFPSSQYEISIHAQMQGMEGPPISVTDMTRTLHTEIAHSWNER